MNLLTKVAKKMCFLLKYEPNKPNCSNYFSIFMTIDHLSINLALISTPPNVYHAS